MLPAENQKWLCKTLRGGRAYLNGPLRGLNQNHNHDLKDLFKGVATTASARDGIFREFYLGLLQKRMQPEMARLTLARKIAAITLKIWKKEEGTLRAHRKRSL
jgi:transposase